MFSVEEEILSEEFAEKAAKELNEALSDQDPIIVSNSTLRQLKLLEILPRQPLKKSPQNLQDELLQTGFEVSVRTIQRDLKVLSEFFL